MPGYKKKTFSRFARKPARRVIRRRRPMRMFRRMPRPEMKYNDVSNNITVTTTPTITLFNGMVKGTDAVSRLGQQITARSNYFFGFTKINVSAAESFIRIALVLDHQPDGLAFTMADVFTNADTISPRNIGNSARFTILFDKHYALSINGRQISTVKSFKKIGFITRFNTGNAGTIADIQSNSLYLVTVSNEATNGVALTYQNRFRWVDP